LARTLSHQAARHQGCVVGIVAIDRERDDSGDWTLTIAHNDFFSRPDLLEVLREPVSKVRDIRASHAE
jgi:hypothetical protein